jgi:integrase
MGMNFIDIAKLKKSQLKNAVYKNGKLISCFLEYIRSKQKRSEDPKSFRIKQTEKAIKILNYFGIYEKKENDFVFPFQLDNNYASHQTYKQRLKRINNRLTKIVQDQLGYKEEICTSYVIRHTWATSAMKLNIPIQHISAGMGHKSIEKTQIYCAELDNDDVDDVNAQIVELTEI